MHALLFLLGLLQQLLKFGEFDIVKRFMRCIHKGELLQLICAHGVQIPHRCHRVALVRLALLETCFEPKLRSFLVKVYIFSARFR